MAAPMTTADLYAALTGPNALNTLRDIPIRCEGLSTHSSSPAHKLQLYWEEAGPLFRWSASPRSDDAFEDAPTKPFNVRGAYLKMDQLRPEVVLPRVKMINITTCLTLDDKDPSAAALPMTPMDSKNITITPTGTYIMTTGLLNGCSLCWRRSGDKLYVAHLKPSPPVTGLELTNALLEKGYINGARVQGVYGKQPANDPRYPGYEQDPQCCIYGIWSPALDGAAPNTRWRLYAVSFMGANKAANIGAGRIDDITINYAAVAQAAAERAAAAAATAPAAGASPAVATT